MSDFEVVPIDEEGPSIIDELPTEDTDEEPVIDDIQDDPSVPEGGEPESTEEAPEPEPDRLMYASEVDELPTEDTDEEPVIDDEPDGGEQPYEPDINDNVVDIPIVGTADEEQQVIMMMRDGSPVAVGSVGSGDRVMSMASDAVTIADEAARVAEVTGQHFWQRSDDPDDDGAGTGAFVTEDEQDSFTAAAAIGFPDLGDESESMSQTDTFVGDGEKTSFELAYRPVSTTVSVTVDGVQVSDVTVSGKNITFETAPANESAITATYDRAKKPWHNLLMNSLGILLRSGTRNLASLTKSAIAFFDGTGNSASNITASFGKDGAQVGPSSRVHSVIEPGSFTIRDRNETTFVDFHLANDDNTGYVIVPWSVTADGDTTVFTFRSNVLETSVRINGAVVSSGWHLDGNSIVFDTAPAAGSAVDFLVTTDEPVPVMTIGRRKDGTEEGQYSRVLGVDCTASGYISEASGYQTRALDDECHAEGYMTKASGWAAHAEGVSTQAEGDMSHAEGLGSLAMGTASHASGHLGIAAGECSHAEGHRSMATGNASHAQNSGTIAASTNQTALGRWNVSDTDETFAVIIGNGTDAQNRRNAMGVRWSGTTRKFLDVDTRKGGQKPSGTVNVGEEVYDNNGQVFYSFTSYNSAGAIYRSQIVRKFASGGSELATNGFYYGVRESGDPYWTIQNAPQFRTAIGLGIYASLMNQSSSLTLTTSAQKVPLHGTFAQYGGCSESSNGIKVPVAGVYLITGLAYFTTGFAVNDIIHIELRKNGSSLGDSLCRVYLASAQQSFSTPTQIVSLAANDVITLHAWNQTAARGTVASRSGHGITLVKIA